MTDDVAEETTTAGVLRSTAHHLQTSRTTVAEALKVATVHDGPMHRAVAVNAFWHFAGEAPATFQSVHGVDATVAKLREVADQLGGN